MNLLIPAAVIGALLAPSAPVASPSPSPSPSPSTPRSPEASTGRVSVAHGWPEPARPAAEWPLQPRPEIAAGFDPPSTTWSAGHRGVDLVGRPGARVRTALPGRVTFAGRVAGRGVVVVDHGAFRTTYEPVRSAVRRGDRVEVGAVIGRLESARSHCAPRACLHWGLVADEGYRDPLALLRKRQVRLLPLGDEPQARGWARW